MSDPLTVQPSNPFLAWFTAAGVAALAGMGFVLSFRALQDLAVRSGIDAELAWLWPLVVDGFIVVATAAAFGLKRRGKRVTWYPWAALILFALLSIAGNAAHAANAVVTVPLWIATVVSAVPAIALLVASHLLVVLVDGKSRPSAKRKRARQSSTSAADLAEVFGISPTTAQPTLRALVAPANVVTALEDHVASFGGPVTASLIAEVEGCSERTARRRVSALRESHPHLFAAQSVAS